MCNYLGHLPTEILMKIVDELVVQDEEEYSTLQYLNPDSLIFLMNWSSTSFYFRNMFAPYIFQFVELRNEEKCGGSLVALAKGKHACLVKTINFFGSVPINADENYSGIAFSDTIEIFPKTVVEVLSNLQYFSSLETLGIEFSYYYYATPEDSDSTVEEASEEQVRNAKEGKVWRALMTKTYEALVKNKTRYIKGLALRYSRHKHPSTFTNQHFHDFLSHIEAFSLSFSDWQTIKAKEYIAFASKLDTMLFDHTLHLKTLMIKAPVSGPLGQPGTDGWSLVPLALKKNQMPFLETACFQYIIICPQLTDFLVDHSRTLKHLWLYDCFITMLGGGKTGGDIYWQQFFDRLCDAHFEKLCRVVIMPLDLPLDHRFNEELEETNSEILITRQILQNPNSGRRLFAYAELDDQDDTLYPCGVENLAAFKRGADQTSYDKLMEKVNFNAVKNDNAYSPTRRLGTLE